MQVVLIGLYDTLCLEYARWRKKYSVRKKTPFNSKKWKNYHHILIIQNGTIMPQKAEVIILDSVK